MNEIEKFFALKDVRVTAMRLLIYKFLADKQVAVTLSDIENAFEKADRKTFKNLDLSFYSMRKGGNSACVLNAANEIVVEAFLNEEINFLNIDCQKILPAFILYIYTV